MKLQINKSASILGIFITAALLFDSCTKNTECTGEINVTRLATGAAVPNATVRIFVPSGGFYPCSGEQISEKILTTDASGKATFCLKLPATLNVAVTAGALTGTGVIATEVGKPVASPIKLQ